MSVLVNVCFHGIGVPGRALEPGEARYWVSTRQYSDLLDVLGADERVRISFDDGNASDVAHGLPALLERGMTATYFPVAGRLGQPGSLAPEQLREIVAAGMTVGSHGMDHRPWKGLDPRGLLSELEEARAVLSKTAGVDVYEAAVPLGQYNRSLLRHLRHLGYRTVHTSDRRWARDRSWIQPRFSIRAEDTPDSVRNMILGPQPWRGRAGRAAVCTVKRWR